MQSHILVNLTILCRNILTLLFPASPLRQGMMMMQTNGCEGLGWAHGTQFSFVIKDLMLFVCCFLNMHACTGDIVRGQDGNIITAGVGHLLLSAMNDCDGKQATAMLATELTELVHG